VGSEKVTKNKGKKKRKIGFCSRRGLERHGWKGKRTKDLPTPWEKERNY